MDKPLVSIITPVYNAEKFLDETIRSVIGQTYSNWELWLVDDHSTDHSRSVIDKYAAADHRIRPVFIEVNSGAAVARNKAIAESKGKFIAFIDADDIWHPNKLEKQVAFMVANNYAFSFHYYQHIGNKNRIIKSPSQVSYRQLLKNNIIGCLTAMYDAEKTGKQLMPDIRKRQDYGLWLNILRTGVIAYCLPENLASYRIDKNSLSGNKTAVLKYNWLLLRKYQKLSVVASLYYFGCFLVNKSFKYLK